MRLGNWGRTGSKVTETSRRLSRRSSFSVRAEIVFQAIPKSLKSFSMNRVYTRNRHRSLSYTKNKKTMLILNFRFRAQTVNAACYDTTSRLVKLRRNK